MRPAGARKLADGPGHKVDWQELAADGIWRRDRSTTPLEVQVWAPGHEQRSLTVAAANEPSTPEPTIVRCVLRSTTPVSGRVVDEAERAVPDAWVRVGFLEERTDERGQFTLASLPAVSPIAAVGAAGYTREHFALVPSPFAESSTELEWTLRRSAPTLVELRAPAASEFGENAEKYVVEAKTREGKRRFVAERRSASRFEFVDVPQDAELELRVRRHSPFDLGSRMCDSLAAPRRTQAGDACALTLLPHRPLRVELRDGRTGEPLESAVRILVEGAEREVWWRDENGAVTRELEHGVLETEGVPEFVDLQSLKVYAEGYAAAECHCDERESYEIELWPESERFLTLRADDGEWLEGVQMRWIADGQVHAATHSPTRSDAGGRIVVPDRRAEQAGAYRLFHRDTGVVEVSVEEVEAALESPESELVLERGAVLTIVARGPRGEWMAEVGVEMRGPDETRPLRTRIEVVATGRTKRADEQGIARWRGLNAGSYAVRLAEECLPDRTIGSWWNSGEWLEVDLRPGEHRTIELTGCARRDLELTVLEDGELVDNAQVFLERADATSAGNLAAALHAGTADRGILALRGAPSAPLRVWIQTPDRVTVHERSDPYATRWRIER